MECFAILGVPHVLVCAQLANHKSSLMALSRFYCGFLNNVLLKSIFYIL